MDNFFEFAVAAVLIESVVFAVGEIQTKNFEWKYIMALVVGMVVAVNFSLDAFEFLGLEGRLPYAGAVLTGLTLSRGSNYVADFFKLVGSFRRG